MPITTIAHGRRTRTYPRTDLFKVRSHCGDEHRSAHSTLAVQCALRTAQHLYRIQIKQLGIRRVGIVNDVVWHLVNVEPNRTIVSSHSASAANVVGADAGGSRW